ncbi:MAG: glycerate kinase [Bacteroidetes bacterium]|nr:glycerate kinase [Bacteroidota bacterium]
MSSTHNHPTRILIAPNAFKHGIDATGAALAIQKGLQNSTLDCTCQTFPIGDGGDGTCELIIQHLGGQRATADVHDALGRPIDASYGLIDDGKTAVIEMANASGLRLIKKSELNPLIASSYGAGELIRSALDQGVNKIIFGIGGSATVDGGTGILEALGIRFLGDNHQPLSGLPEALNHLTTIDLSGLDPRIHSCELVVLCDVDNLLLGPAGAAAVFGPQKGATEQSLPILEAALSRFAQTSFQLTGIDMTQLIHGGAAGGVSSGLYTFLGAKLVSGIDYFLEITGFDEALQNSDVVITGEGSIDEQTLQGKGPYGVAHRAKEHGLPVIGLAGKIPVETNTALGKYFDALLAIGNEPASLETALRATAQNLTRTGEAIGNLLAMTLLHA